MDELVCDLVFEKFKAQGCSVEAQERWSPGDLSCKHVLLIHDVFLVVSLDELDRSSSRESGP